MGWSSRLFELGGQNLEHVPVDGYDNLEVLAIDGGDLCRAQPLGSGDDHGVHRVKRRVGVPVHDATSEAVALPVKSVVILLPKVMRNRNIRSGQVSS